jgi:polysaccharide biosynthesis protein PslJ
MRAVEGSAQRGPIVSASIVLGALAVLSLATLADVRLQEVVPLTAAVILWALAYRFLLAWRNLLAVLILVILFIPIRRYSLPGNLPFNMEPYRLLVAIIITGWLASLLVDPRVRLRRSGFEAPLALFGLAILGSQIFNSDRVAAVETYAVKQATFFASFALILFVIVSTVRTRKDVDRLLALLVAGGSVVAAMTIVEARTGFNAFNHLSGVIPLLREEVLPWVGQDGRGDRAFASAQHPIALGAALAMLVPFSIYLGSRTGRRAWFAASGLLAIASLATFSRTSVLMLVVMALVYLWLRPRETRRFWPALVPVLVVIHFLVPGTLGTIKNAFFPAGGLIAQQQAEAGTAGSGRLADLGPGLREWAQRPILGEGFGTRVVDGPASNAGILDDQWLGILLETGLVGTGALLWLFSRAIRRLAAEARKDRSANGLLPVGLTASIYGYAVGMTTFDSFAFIQVTFLLFFALAFAGALCGAPAPRKAPMLAFERARRRVLA